MARRVIILLGILALVVAVSCEDKSINGSGFWVKIVDQARDPVVGTHISFVYPWMDDSIPRITNGYGLVNLSDEYRGTFLYIYKNNHHTITVNDIEEGTYTLPTTPLELIEIGEIEGPAIRIDSDFIMTVTSDGRYHIYAYDGDGVIERTTGELPVTDWISRMDFEFYDNLLWYSAAEQGIYVYNLTFPLYPVQVAHLEFDSSVRYLEKSGTLLAVNTYHDDTNLHVYHVLPDYSLDELYATDAGGIAVMKLLSHCLVLHSGGATKIFDINDPFNIDLVYDNTIYEDSYAIFHGDTLVLAELVGEGGTNSGLVDHYMVDLSDPTNPSIVYHLIGYGRISAFIDDTLAVSDHGLYHFDSGILRRTSRDEFEVAAVISENWGQVLGYHPFYVIGNKVWKLR